LLLQVKCFFQAYCYLCEVLSLPYLYVEFFNSVVSLLKVYPKRKNFLPFSTKYKKMFTQMQEIFSIVLKTWSVPVDYVPRDTCESCCRDVSEVFFVIYFE